MSKKIFISWSGRLSEMVAQLFKRWIPNVIQDVEPFFSTEDIKKGRRAVETIQANMRDALYAISCLTQSNKERPWIEYEAGFLSALNVPVSGFLINLGVDDLKLPLSNFQHTLFDKEDVKRLLNDVRETCQSIITQSQFDNNFEREWPVLETALTAILSDKSIISEEKMHVAVVTEERVIEIVNSAINNRLEDYHPTKIVTKQEHDDLMMKGLIEKDTVYIVVG